MRNHLLTPEETDIYNELKQACSIEDACDILDQIGIHYMPNAMAMSWACAGIFLDGLYMGIRLVYLQNEQTLRGRDQLRAWRFWLDNEDAIREEYMGRHTPRMKNA